jgi:predicted glycogen debranching enzyme
MPSGSAIVLGPQLSGTTAGFGPEWLVTDGTGGYATGTVGGLRTRRYHALLVAPDDTRTRKVALVALDPVVTLPTGAAVALATHQWVSGDVQPAGHQHLERFELVDGVPRWRWRIGDIVIERELAMAYGRSAVAVVHRLVSGPKIRLTLTALCTWRDADAERDHTGPRPRITAASGGVVVESAYRLTGPGWRPVGEWYLGAYAREEAARGLNPAEDLWAAGAFSATLDTGQAVEVLGWTGDLDEPPPPAHVVVSAARKRARKTIRQARAAHDIDATLALAADAFVVRTPTGPGIVAGYPWFGSYPRDTMASYEGLLLHTGRADEGRDLLRAHAPSILDAAVAREPAPGLEADAPLWFVHALDRHVARTGDTDLAAELLPAVTAVIDAYTDGAVAGVTVDGVDGLLDVHDTTGLTWMNARVGGRAVTPRDGKPVDVNALWANALAAHAMLVERAGGDSSVHAARVDAVRGHFGKRFPASEGWLYDVVDAPPAPYPLGGGSSHDDPVVRPNQLLAYSLPYAPLDPDPRALAAIGAKLLTPMGLRTLAPTEIGYHGAHRGDVVMRDEAYHQGTVWPWLIGHYVEACRAASLPLSGLLTGLHGHLGEAGLGSVSETADGDAPYRATGCPFSARSVAELIRARSLARDVGPRDARAALR